MTDISFDNTSRILETEQGNIHYHEIGSGPVLLMIHGSGPGVTGWANFEGNLELFSQHFRCIIIDLPGYGKSDAAPGNPILESVMGTLRLLGGLNIEKAHIIGNSLGGIVASQIAAHHPQRVGRLVMIGGIGMNIFSSFPAEGLQLLSEFAENPTRENVIRWLNAMVYDRKLVTEELIEKRLTQATEPKTLASTRALYSREAIEGMQAMFAGPDATQRIAHYSSIQAPTLLTWGRDDRVSPIDMALIPMRLIPKCELHTFPNCGHWAMIEAKDAFENVTLAFLTRSDDQ